MAKEHGILMVGGRCQNPRSNDDGGICGQPIGAHPDVQQDVSARKRSRSEAEELEKERKVHDDDLKVHEDLLSKFLLKTEELLTTMRALHHLQMERSIVFRDSALLYKRGIIDLQLQIFISLHDHVDDGHQLRMVCDNGWDAPLSFTSAMKHWLNCPKHPSAPCVYTHFEDGLMVIKNTNKKEVEKSIENLYATISQTLHFNAGESFPLKIVRFAQNADTLAMISFLSFYDVNFSIVGDQPVPAESSHDTKEEAEQKEEK
eukprot:gene38149-50026_t